MDDGAPLALIGVGNRLRGDDGAGLLVAEGVRRRLAGGGFAVLEQPGEAIGLIEQWEPFSGVVVVDAVRSGAPAGTIHRIDATAGPLPAPLLAGSSTHAVGVAHAIELARAVGRLPARLVLLGIEGRSFHLGDPLSGPVAGAIPALLEAALGELEGLRRAAVTAGGAALGAPRSHRRAS